MCLLLRPPLSACCSLPSAHPASCLSASSNLIFACVFLINQSDVFAAEMATRKASAGVHVSRRPLPTLWQMVACAWVRENGGHRLRPQGALWPEQF